MPRSITCRWSRAAPAAGVAGESSGAGLVVDLSRHFRQIVDVGSDTIRVQPGVTLQQVNTRLARDGRRFAPDPASAATCTLGGMLATNASGSRAIKHGYTRDHVAALRLVLDNGDVVGAGREPVETPSPSPPPSTAHGTHWHDIAGTVAILLEQNDELIRSAAGRTAFNRCGYTLGGVLSDNSLDVPRLLIGSEGTLALFTEATLRTVPLPGGQALLLLGFASLDAALQAVRSALPSQPSACELIDRRLLSLARTSEAANVACWCHPRRKRFCSLSTRPIRRARPAMPPWNWPTLLYRNNNLAIHAVPAFEQADIDQLWRLREVALPSLYSLRGGTQPMPFIEDVGVPLEQLPELPATAFRKCSGSMRRPRRS